MYMISLWPKWENIDLGRWASHLCLLQGLLDFKTFESELNLRKFLFAHNKLLMLKNLADRTSPDRKSGPTLSGRQNIWKYRCEDAQFSFFFKYLPSVKSILCLLCLNTLVEFDKNFDMHFSVVRVVLLLLQVFFRQMCQYHLSHYRNTFSYSMLHCIPGRWQRSPPSHICHTLAGSHRGAPHQPHQVRPWAIRLELFRKVKT